MLCEELSIVEVCQPERSSKQVRDCATGSLVRLADMCASVCPFDIARELDVFGAPVSGVGALLDKHPDHPGSEPALLAGSLVYWLRPSDAFFDPAAGVWTAVTGRDVLDRDNASLFDASDVLLSTSASVDLLRSDRANTSDRDLNFNPYVDLGGGFIEFERPARFKGDVSIFMVVRNKMGDAKYGSGQNKWYQRPALLSGEHDGGQDFGVTLNQGKIEWSRNRNDDPAVTSGDTFDQGGWHVVVVTRNRLDGHGNAGLYVDGTNQNKGKMAEGDFLNPLIRIGRHPEPWQDHGQWHGEVAEVMLYDSLVNNETRERIQTYLAIKYGISLEANYVDAQNNVIYDLSKGAGEHIFGLMCYADFALQQYASRASDGLLSLRAGGFYKGVDECPTAPASFSLLMGDDGGPLAARQQPVTIMNRSGRAIEVTVLERTWKLRSSAVTPATFTVTLDGMHPDFTTSNFVPEMLVLTDVSGNQLVVPVNLYESRYYATTFLSLSNAGLDLSDHVTMQLARFVR